MFRRGFNGMFLFRLLAHAGAGVFGVARECCEKTAKRVGDHAAVAPSPAAGKPNLS